MYKLPPRSNKHINFKSKFITAQNKSRTFKNSIVSSAAMSSENIYTKNDNLNLIKQPLTATIPVNSAQVIRHLSNQPSSGLPQTAVLSPENKSESNPTANTICPSSEL